MFKVCASCSGMSSILLPILTEVYFALQWTQRFVGWPRATIHGTTRKEHSEYMDWDRSETIALAKTSCTHCHGDGLRPGRGSKSSACNCVLRAVFRACYARFR